MYIPYVLICGSYQSNRINDKLCAFVGNELAKRNIGIISAGGKPAIKVAESMNKILTDLDQYDPFKIMTVFRKRNYGDELKIKRIGCNLFVGNDLQELREYIFSRVKVLIAVGGATKTREEILMAQEHKIPVIPIGMTGGTAFSVWNQFQRSGTYEDKTTFFQLNTKNSFIASNAVLAILKKLIQDD